MFNALKYQIYKIKDISIMLRKLCLLFLFLFLSIVALSAQNSIEFSVNGKGSDIHGI